MTIQTATYRNIRQPLVRPHVWPARVDRFTATWKYTTESGSVGQLPPVPGSPRPKREEL